MTFWYCTVASPRVLPVGPVTWKFTTWVAGGASDRKPSTPVASFPVMTNRRARPAAVAVMAGAAFVSADAKGTVNALLATIDDYRVEVLITLATVVGGYALADAIHVTVSGESAAVRPCGRATVETRTGPTNLPTPTLLTYPVFDETGTEFLNQYYTVESFGTWQSTASPSCPSTSLRILSAPLMCSYST